MITYIFLLVYLVSCSLQHQSRHRTFSSEKPDDEIFLSLANLILDEVSSSEGSYEPTAQELIQSIQKSITEIDSKIKKGIFLDYSRVLKKIPEALENYEFDQEKFRRLSKLHNDYLDEIQELTSVNRREKIDSIIIDFLNESVEIINSPSSRVEEVQSREGVQFSRLTPILLITLMFVIPYVARTNFVKVNKVNKVNDQIISDESLKYIQKVRDASDTGFLRYTKERLKANDYINKAKTKDHKNKIRSMIESIALLHSNGKGSIKSEIRTAFYIGKYKVDSKVYYVMMSGYFELRPSIKFDRHDQRFVFPNKRYHDAFLLYNKYEESKSKSIPFPPHPELAKEILIRVAKGDTDNYNLLLYGKKPYWDDYKDYFNIDHVLLKSRSHNFVLFTLKIQNEESENFIDQKKALKVDFDWEPDINAKIVNLGYSSYRHERGINRWTYNYWELNIISTLADSNWRLLNTNYLGDKSFFPANYSVTKDHLGSPIIDFKTSKVIGMHAGRKSNHPNTVKGRCLIPINDECLLKFREVQSEAPHVTNKIIKLLTSHELVRNMSSIKDVILKKIKNKKNTIEVKLLKKILEKNN